MIIIGYFQIGKTSLAKKNKNYIDLDQYQFFIKGKRDASNWYIPYCQLAEYLSKQGHKVLVCAHSNVVEYFSKSSEQVMAICPHPNLLREGKWIDKYKDGLRAHKETDEQFIDLRVSKTDWNKVAEFVYSISMAFQHTIYITSMNYDLEAILSNNIFEV